MDIKPNSVIHLAPGETLPGYTNLKPVPDKYFDELKALINKLNTQSGNIYLKLKQMYAFLDRFNKEFVSTFTSCQKGCSSCCKMDVHLTALEATHIAQASKLTARDNPLTTGHESKCPFLSEKGTCSIYNYRPLLCRTYHVLTPPEMCNDLDAQVMQYGSQSANMGNHIYKTIAEWIYFQTYHCTGKLETKDIRDYFPYPREDIQRFLHHNPPRPFC
ncbi:YkgJ family cysteine cluster protein [Escherichia coli]